MFSSPRARPIDYRRLARDQRVLAWLTLIILCGHVCFAAVGSGANSPFLASLQTTMMVAWILGFIWAATLVGSITDTLGGRRLSSILLAVFAFVPVVGLIPMIAVIARLNKHWKHLGLKPTIFGVDPELAAGVQHGTRCAGCGYDLRGNESGVCPECGSSISPSSRNDASSLLQSDVDK